jgi:hypothetical protein
MEKDVAYYEYLAKIRKDNKQLFEKCQICSKPSVTVEADGYRVYPVCLDHIRAD